jgi:hypothetical protein
VLHAKKTSGNGYPTVSPGKILPGPVNEYKEDSEDEVNKEAQGKFFRVLKVNTL